MSVEPQALERSVLEAKEREELQTIAQALGLKVGARARKADLVDQILVGIGVEEPKPKPRRTRKKAVEDNGSSASGGGSEVSEVAEMPVQGELPVSTNGEAQAPSGEPMGEGAALGPEAPPSRVEKAQSVDAEEAPAGVSVEVSLEQAGAGEEAPGEQAAPLSAAAAAEGSAAQPHEEVAVQGQRGEEPPSASEPSGQVEGSAEADQLPTGEDRGVVVVGTVEGAETEVAAAEVAPEVSGDEAGAATAMGAEVREAKPAPPEGDRQGERDQRRERDRDRDRDRDRGDQRGRGDRQGPVSISGEPEPGNRRSRRRRGRDRERGGDFRAQEIGQEQQPYSGELIEVEGLLDLRDEGYGFLRASGYLASSRDVYVSLSQVRRFALRKGDYVRGASRPASNNEKYPALVRIDSVSGLSLEEARTRRRFEDLTPLFPDEKLRLEVPGDSANMVARIVDLISPIGKGQRGLIVSPPKAGKTTVLKQIAHSIEANNPEVHLMVLLVDERPEEVTDMRRSVKGEVVASTFDRPSDEHTQVAELALERAKRLVEMGKDVVIVLDGITRLARAYNLAAPASGRILSGGVDSAALYQPKKFFGSARNIEEGGSLTILATALVETGSRMDEVIFEEFKGTGNMELRLDRKLAERRVYPAIDVNASSTRHEELLFERKQLELVWRLRRVLNGLAEGGSSAAGLELLMDKIKTTKSNDEFLSEIAKAPAVAM